MLVGLRSLPCVFVQGSTRHFKWQTGLFVNPDCAGTDLCRLEKRKPTYGDYYFFSEQVCTAFPQVAISRVIELEE